MPLSVEKRGRRAKHITWQDFGRMESFDFGPWRSSPLQSKGWCWHQDLCPPLEQERSFLEQIECSLGTDGDLDFDGLDCIVGTDGGIEYFERTRTPHRFRKPPYGRKIQLHPSPRASSEVQIEPAP